MNIRVNAASRALFVVIGLILATWVVTLSFGFVWDDLPSVVTNPSLRSWGTLGKAFASDFWGLHELPAKSGYWRPMPTVAYTVLTHFFGTSAVAFHALNLLLHIGVCVAAFILFGRLGLSDPARGIAVLFFALHPIHAETVSFVSALPDLMAAFLGLTALIGWSSSSNQKNRDWWFGTGLFILALLSKESALAFGLVGLWLSPARKRFLLTLIPILSLYAVVHFGVTGGVGIRSLWGGEIGTHLGTVVKLLPYMVLLTFVPIGSSPTREFSISTGWSDPLVWGAMVTVVILGFLIWKNRNSNLGKGAILLSLFWLPVSNLVPAEGLLADRYLYLPVIGTAFAMGSFLGFLWSSKQYQMLCRAILVFLIVCWGAWAFIESMKWKSNETLWSSAIKTSPQSPVAWNEWGGVLLKKGKLDEAKRAFESAVTFRPEYREASFNLGVTTYQTGNLNHAFRQTEDHLKRFPQDAAAWDLLGSIQVRQGDFVASIQNGKRAVELAPSNWKYRFNLGINHAAAQVFPPAIQQLEKARGLAPNQQEVWFQLGFVYFTAANWKKAEEVFEEIVQRWPGNKRGQAALRKVREILVIAEKS